MAADPTLEPDGRPPRRGVGRPRVLSQERIIEAALAVVGGSGPEALTARRLGRALGVDPSAIYRHFASKDDLVLAMADQLITIGLDGFEPQDDWRTTMTDIGHRARRVLLAHPQAAHLLSHRTTRRPGEMRAVEIAIGVLREAGFGTADAALYHRVFTDFVLSWTRTDAELLSLDPEARAGDEAAWRNEYANLSEEEYPNIVAARDHIGGSDDPELLFQTALDLMLDAIAERLRTLPGQPPASYKEDPQS